MSARNSVTIKYRWRDILTNQADRWDGSQSCFYPASRWSQRRPPIEFMDGLVFSPPLCGKDLVFWQFFAWWSAVGFVFSFLLFFYPIDCERANGFADGHWEAHSASGGDSLSRSTTFIESLKISPLNYSKVLPTGRCPFTALHCRFDF